MKNIEPGYAPDAPQYKGYLQRRYAGMQRWYGIKAEWEMNGKVSELRYQAEIRCIEEKQDTAIWSLRKQQYFIDQKQSENPVYALAIACADQYYPLQVELYKSGGLKSILNQQMLQERFSRTKEELARNYGGVLAEQYIAQSEAALASETQLRKLVEQELWFSLFFQPLYTGYDKDRRKQMNMTLPLLGFWEGLVFGGYAEVDFQPVTENVYTIDFSGTLDRQQIPEMMQYKFGIQGGTVTVSYDLERQDCQIRNVVCNARLQTLSGECTAKISGFYLKDKMVEADLEVTTVKASKGPWARLFS